MLTREQVASAAIMAAFGHEPATAMKVQEVVEQIFSTLESIGCTVCGMPRGDVSVCSACAAEAATADLLGKTLAVHIHERVPDGMPDEWVEVDKPFARVSYCSDPGDPEVGIPAMSGWFLDANQAGTLVADLIASAAPVAEARSLFEAKAARIEADARNALQNPPADASVPHRFRLAIEHRTQIALIAELRSAMSQATESPVLHQQQATVAAWVERAFGPRCASNIHERVARVLEEAIELAQAEGLSETEAEAVLRYVYGRPLGEPDQEVGGVMVTLLAYAAARGVSLLTLAQREIDRVRHKPLAHFAARNAQKAAAGIVAYPAEPPATLPEPLRS